VSDLVSGLRDLVTRLDDEDNAACDLWSWLPSKAVAEKHHGDYYGNVRPSNADVMSEAAMLLAELRGSQRTPEERAKWFERCPCGESHEEESEGKSA
jgi:hypothetical protein